MTKATLSIYSYDISVVFTFLGKYHTARVSVAVFISKVQKGLFFQLFFFYKDLLEITRLDQVTSYPLIHRNPDNFSTGHDWPMHICFLRAVECAH